MKRSVLPAVLKRNLVTITPTLSLASKYWKLTGSLVHQPGNNLNTECRARKVVAKPQTINRDLPRDRKLINDNYCATQLGCVWPARRILYL